jgi:Cell wall-associated hydrolases (invasion-associated proteins)
MELRTTNSKNKAEKNYRTNGIRGGRLATSGIRGVKSGVVKLERMTRSNRQVLKNVIRNSGRESYLWSMSKEQLKQWNSYSAAKQKQLLAKVERLSEKSSEISSKTSLGMSSAKVLSYKLNRLAKGNAISNTAGMGERWEVAVPVGKTVKEMRKSLKSGEMQTEVFYTDNIKKGMQKTKELENKLNKAVKLERKEKKVIFNSILAKELERNLKKDEQIKAAIANEQISAYEAQTSSLKNIFSTLLSAPKAQIKRLVRQAGHWVVQLVLQAGRSLVIISLPLLLPITIFALLIFGIGGLGGSSESGSGAIVTGTGLYTSVDGEAIVAYARQFIGNPYVWGGTSLTNGADCSGFIQSVYANFGVKLPRTASEQSNVGIAVEYINDLVPGDLIVYHSSASASGWHIGIYDGAGKIVEAQGKNYGITNNRAANRGNIVAMRRLVSDVVATGAGGGNITGEQGEYLGEFKLTGYCPCVKCCGKWAGGPTASGVMPTPNKTVAISKSTANRLGLRFGDKLLIDGVGYVYEDGGDSNMAGNNWIDIFVATHEECYASFCNKPAAQVYRLI